MDSQYPENPISSRVNQLAQGATAVGPDRTQNLIQAIRSMDEAVNHLSGLLDRITQRDEVSPECQPEQPINSLHDLLEFGPAHLAENRERMLKLTSCIAQELF